MLRVARTIVAGTPGDMSGRALRRATVTAVVTASGIAHLIGIAIVVLLLTLVLPTPQEADQVEVLVRNLIVAAVYVAVAVPAGLVRGMRAGTRALRWLDEERRPSAEELRGALRMPGRILRLEIALWLGAVVLLGLANLTTSVLFAFEIAITLAIGGATTASMVYLLQLRLSRSVTARALAGVVPRQEEAPGIGVRAVLTWALTTGGPVGGAVVLAALSLGEPVTTAELGRAVLVLGALALAVGLGATVVLARSIAEPVERLRDALEAVERGDLDTQVPVNDPSELGALQAGFNRMVAGLRERERVRDLFGRHVGEDVARRALEEGVSLGGEEREAAALFVDVVGSTTYAAEHRPSEVVETLNAFFDVVVAVTREFGGLVNKFEGDAALCVFGAPLPMEDPRSCALKAARELARRLREDVPDVRAGIGVSAGTVVAGNIGAQDRFEYTVIGDPVNEAARLTELAKERDGLVLASARIVEGADEDERARWRLEDEEVTLRGRPAPTRLAVPRDVAARGTASGASA